MRYIYIAVSFMALLYTVSKKRRPDFFSIYIASSIVYYMPLFWGKVNDMQYIKKLVFFPADILDETYIFGIINLLTVLIWMVFKDRSGIGCKGYNIVEKAHHSAAIKAVCCCNLILIIIRIIQLREFLFGKNYNKVLLVQQLTVWDSLARYVSLYIMVYGYTVSKDGLIKTMGALFAAYGLYMGRRSDFVIAVIACALYYFSNHYKVGKSILYVLTQNKRITIVLFLFVIVVFPLKKTLPMFREGDWIAAIQNTIEKMFDIQTYSYSEANTITCHINKILDKRLYVEMESYLTAVFDVIPFMETLSGGALSGGQFYKVFQTALYPTIGITVMGLGGTFWGEVIANGGFLLLLIFLNIHMLFMMSMERIISRISNTHIALTVMVLCVYLSFYIHRLFLESLLGIFKFMFLILIMVIGIDFFLSVFYRKKLRSIFVRKINWTILRS